MGMYRWASDCFSFF